MLTIKHSKYTGPVVEYNYDYWSLYWKNQLILASKSEQSVKESFNTIIKKLKEMNYVLQ